jgi:predicted nuclease of restriction endonuclease-like (RecB) superfamily
VVDGLTKALGAKFSGGEGFGLRNLRYMRCFAEPCPDSQILQRAAKLHWGHQMVFLDLVKYGQSREWYLRASIEHGWSLNVLPHHIPMQLREREGKAQSNFSRTLPTEDSGLAQQILTDPYSFSLESLTLPEAQGAGGTWLLFPPFASTRTKAASQGGFPSQGCG